MGRRRPKNKNHNLIDGARIEYWRRHEVVSSFFEAQKRHEMGRLELSHNIFPWTPLDPLAFLRRFSPSLTPLLC